MSNTSVKELRIEKAAADRILAKTLRNSILVVIVLALASYIVTASTIARYMYTNIGIQYVATPAFEGGIAPEGAVVLVKPGSENSFTLGENLLNSFIPHDNIVKVSILEGNYGEPDWKAYEGLEPTESGYLDNEYIAQCILGCEEGAFVVIDAQSIIGSVSKD